MGRTHRGHPGWWKPATNPAMIEFYGGFLIGFGAVILFMLITYDSLWTFA